MGSDSSSRPFHVDRLEGPLGDDMLRVFDGVKGRWMTDREARHYLRNLPYEFYIRSRAKPSEAGQVSDIADES